MASTSGLLRSRDEADSRVTNLELFFDLVYVFAVTQIAHVLLEDLTVRGAIRSAMILLAVWWAWMYTTWFTNWVHPDRLPVRLALIGIMLGSLIMSASIPEAFHHRALGFAGAFVTIQVLRSLFMIRSLQDEEAFRLRNFQRIVLWSIFSGIFWISGIFVEDNSREAIWIVALVIDYAAPALGFWVPGMGRSTTRDWDVAGAHIAERCHLFIIIALGESVLSTGRTFADHPIGVESFITFVGAFVGAVALWWIYFDRFSSIAEDTIATADDPGRLARSAFTYSHIVIIAGIIVSAVANELVIAHPSGEVSTSMAIVTVGGGVLFLLGYAMFVRTITSQLPRPTLVAIAALVAAFLIHSIVTPLVFGLLTVLILVILAAAVRRQHVHIERNPISAKA